LTGFKSLLTNCDASTAVGGGDFYLACANVRDIEKQKNKKLAVI
jgi:hypothetical protein